MQRATAAQRGYGPKWRAARATFLRQRPLCVFCDRRGIRTRATVVDHIEPHRGNPSLFWDQTNWQPLCRTCHNATKQSLEKSGVLRGCDELGIPLDAQHHWR